MGACLAAEAAWAGSVAVAVAVARAVEAAAAAAAEVGSKVAGETVATVENSAATEVVPAATAARAGAAARVAETGPWEEMRNPNEGYIVRLIYVEVRAARAAVSPEIGLVGAQVDRPAMAAVSEVTAEEMVAPFRRKRGRSSKRTLRPGRSRRARRSWRVAPGSRRIRICRARDSAWRSCPARAPAHAGRGRSEGRR